MSFCSPFAFIFLSRIGQLDNVFVAKQGVVIEVDLGVNRQQLAIRRDHERVDLRQ